MRGALGQDSLKGVRCAVQGAGNVSRFMMRALLAEGVELVDVVDVSEESATKASEFLGIKVRVVSPTDLSIFETGMFSI